MTREELEKKAEESFNNKLQKDVCYCTYNEEKIYKDGYIAGAKESMPKWHKVSDKDLPKEKKEYWCKVFFYESEETFNAFLWFNPSTKEFELFENAEEDEVNGFKVKEWCEIP